MQTFHTGGETAIEVKHRCSSRRNRRKKVSLSLMEKGRVTSRQGEGTVGFAVFGPVREEGYSVIKKRKLPVHHVS